METKLNYKLQDLSIEIKPILGLMGYTDGDIPPLIIDTIESELKIAEDHITIEGGYIIKNTVLNSVEHTIQIGDVTFNPGKDIFKLYEGSEKIALFACTVGDYISLRAKELMDQGLVLEGYIVDVIGSVIIERGMDKIHEHIKEISLNDDMTASNRYSPGYWKWNVTEQKKIFSLLPDNFCGIQLTDGGLMHPVKSVSGLIAIGTNVKFKNYNCGLCSQEHCIYKKNDKFKGCAYSNSSES